MLVLILGIVYVFIWKLIMLITCLCSKLQILGPHGTLIYNPKCVWNGQFNYSSQLSLKVFMYYGCILELKLDMVVLHVHHPCGFRENLGVLKMIMVAFQFHCKLSVLILLARILKLNLHVEVLVLQIDISFSHDILSIVPL